MWGKGAEKRAAEGALSTTIWKCSETENCAGGGREVSRWHLRRQTRDSTWPLVLPVSQWPASEGIPTEENKSFQLVPLLIEWI